MLSGRPRSSATSWSATSVTCQRCARGWTDTRRSTTRQERQRRGGSVAFWGSRPRRRLLPGDRLPGLVGVPGRYLAGPSDDQKARPLHLPSAIAWRRAGGDGAAADELDAELG